MRTQMTPQQVANMNSLTHGSAPPIHDQSTFDQVTQAVDQSNLAHGIGGDAGASHEDWFGSDATGEGLSAHNVRMQSGITRAGDHGEPTGLLASVLTVLDNVPFVGGIARAGEGLVEASQGNPHSVTALQDEAVDIGFDAGGLVAGPILGAVRGGARAATRVLTSTERTLAKGAEAAGSKVMTTTGLKAVNDAGHAGIAASKAPLGTTGKTALAMTGTGTKSIMKPMLKKKAARLLATETASTGAGIAIGEYTTDGHLLDSEYADIESEFEIVDDDPIDVPDENIDGPPLHTHTPTRPPRPARRRGRPSSGRQGHRTSSHVTPHQSQGHNAREEHDAKLADKVQDRSTESGLFPDVTPFHAHQMSDNSNMYIIGALAVIGVSLAAIS